VLTDATGAAVWDATYRPFGEATVTGALTFNLRFPGQYEDAETGLHYNYFRDYDPATGRYIQSDPIGLQGGWNTYAYVRGNPLRFVDPSGLEGVVGVYAGAEALWFGGGYGITYVGCCLEDETRVSMVFVKKCKNSIALSAGVSAGLVTGLDEVCSAKDYLGWFLEGAAGPFNLDLGLGEANDWNSRTGVNEGGGWRWIWRGRFLLLLRTLICADRNSRRMFL
jgi:RHS repeat-associated protein